MARVKSKLTLEANGKVTEFSNSNNYTEEIIRRFSFDSGTSGGTEFYNMISFSPESTAANSTAAPKAFCIYNSGTTGAEVQIQTAKWTGAAPDVTVDVEEYINMLIPAGEMFFSNNLRIIQYSTNESSGMGAETSLSLLSDNVSTALTATVARGGDTSANIDGEDTASATTILVNDGAEKFRAGDYVFFDLSTDDVFKVLSVDSATQLTVQRDVLGYSGQTLTDGADLYMYAGSHLHDKGTEDDSGVNIRTDKGGRFKGQLLGARGVVPRGNAATDVGIGVVPGSVAIQFPEHGAYQNLGVQVSTSDTTSLVASTAYAFRITTSLGTTADIEFTTDSSDVSWGKVIGLINSAMSTANLDFQCAIIDGDVRFWHNKWLSGDTLTLVDDADSSNEPWAVGNVPDTAAHESPVQTKYPDAEIVDIKSGKKVKNTRSMLVDDGNGRLIGDVGGGTIDYESGVVSFTGPFRAEFKVAFSYGSAHAGVPNRSTANANMVKAILGRSTNRYKDSQLTLVVYS